MKNKKKKLKGMKANDLLVGILVVIVFIMLVLRHTILSKQISRIDSIPKSQALFNEYLMFFRRFYVYETNNKNP